MQFVPYLPETQAHVFGAVQLPFPEHTCSEVALIPKHTGMSQTSPVQPVEHKQLFTDLQVPCFEQTETFDALILKHFGMEQLGPV